MKCVETKEQKEQGHCVPWYLALPNLRVLAPLCGNDPNSGHGHEIEIHVLYSHFRVEFCVFHVIFHKECTVLFWIILFTKTLKNLMSG